MMQKSVTIKIPSELHYYSIVRHALLELTEHFSKKEKENLDAALYELVKNSVEHAYKDRKGFVKIELHPFDHGIRIDVFDKGFPLDQHDVVRVPIEDGKERGFNKVYLLVDAFEYINLGTKGKKFSIIKYSAKPITHADYRLSEEAKSLPSDTPIEIREFQKGDEVAISRLIYENYGLSYVKDIFYYPSKILEYHGKKFYSIVAVAQEEIVGHFALVFVEGSDIAEIGIAVVSPKFQGRGIMDAMFDKLLEKANELGLRAIFGEAIMYHPYSQKSNKKHGFCETALELGKLQTKIKLHGNELSKKARRGSVLYGYKILKKGEKRLAFAQQYKAKLQEIYAQCPGIDYSLDERGEGSAAAFSDIRYIYQPEHNVATIVIDSFHKKDFFYTFENMLDMLRAKHTDMIYADINLETISKTDLDTVVELLNEQFFFFSGVLPLKHRNHDYLHLQYKHSEMIEYRNIVCHSSFCKELFEYIVEDEKRVKFALAKKLSKEIHPYTQDNTE